MDHRTLTTDQIDRLFDFVKKKHVPYYDIQVELVDHFASAIETMWQEQPDLPFERAIQLVYGRFPITGFYQVVDTARQAMHRQTWRWVKKAWLSYFQWPRIVLSLTILLAIRLLFTLPIPGIWLFVAALVLVILANVYFYHFRYKVKRQTTQYLRWEAIYEVVSNFIFPLHMFFYFSYDYNWGHLDIYPTWAVWLMAFVLTYSGFLIHILVVQLPQQVQQDLRKQFPRYA